MSDDAAPTCPVCDRELRADEFIVRRWEWELERWVCLECAPLLGREPHPRPHLRLV